MENNIPKNKFYWIYFTGFLLILVLPLLSPAPMFHPPAWGKAISFRIIFSILIFIFIYQLLFKKYDNLFLATVRNILDKKSRVFWPFWLLITLLGIFFLATIFSLEPRFSLWGSPYRGGGFLNYAFYIFFAILIFLLLKSEDWQKIWGFSFIVGLIIALIGVIQKFGLFEEYLVSYKWRPVSTMGGPMFLASYLLLLSFLAFSFGISTKTKKRFFYFGCFTLFIFVIILTATRSALLGLFIGFLFFIFAYPLRKSGDENYNKKIIRLKILFGIVLILSIFGVLWLKTQPQLVQNLGEEEKFFGPFFRRIWASVGEFSIQGVFRSRGDGWKVAFEGLKDRPILGYGPENFSIAFDKYYDPALKGISREPGGGSSSWWDKGHSFIFDYSINAGIPALIIYLSLIGVLFWQLQRIKNKEQKTENKILAHGIQATFIGYLVTNLFSFDVFSTYLISFLFIGYSLSLINLSSAFQQNSQIREENKEKRTTNQAGEPLKYVFLFILFFVFIWFIWQYNLKPLQINKEINKATFLAGSYLEEQEHQAQQVVEKAGYPPNECQSAIAKIEPLLSSHSIIDNYVRLQYIDIITRCAKKYPQTELQLAQKAIPILEEATKLRPTYTRSWQFLAVYISRVLDVDRNLEPEIKEKLAEEAYSSINRALELSPKRQKIFADGARIDLALGRFEEAKEKTQICIDLNPELGNCYWVKALAQINLGKLQEAAENIEIAEEKGYNIKARTAIGQLINVYSEIARKTGELLYYQYIAELYPKLITLEPKNFQYHASLAYVYKILGEYDKAREEAMIVLELSPESKERVEEFLRTLPR